MNPGITTKLAVNQVGEARGVTRGGEGGEELPVNDDLAVVARESKAAARGRSIFERAEARAPPLAVGAPAAG